MEKKQRLELTWIGKDKKARPEPRILLEDKEKSYHAKRRRTEADIFDNILIHGDNLLALKALEHDYYGKVKCIYIDPPFNTKQAFEYYDDGLEHSIWLGLMRDRLRLLWGLMSSDATIFVHIDDNELGYLIVLMDETFGRSNRINIITFKQGAATGHKAINPGVVSTSNFILMYAKDKDKWSPNKVFTVKNERDKRYTQFITNIDKPYDCWNFIPLAKAFAQSVGIDEKTIKKSLGDGYEAKLSEFVVNNASAVIRLARPDYNAVSSDARVLIDKSKGKRNTIFLLKREDHSDMYFLNGERIIFYADKLKLIDGKYITGEPLTSIWDDLLSNNLHNEGGVDFPKNKKPEALIKRCLEIATNPNDLVLDSFAGSGTTGAVAHKMGRKWIMVELGEHAHTHIVLRLQKVIDGTDQGGISKAVNWQGGGGFRYYTLAPTLVVNDEYGYPVISDKYNPEMLAEAVCKLMGYRYKPSRDIYWIHGEAHKGSYIYVTTRSFTQEMLRALSDEVNREQGRTLRICCEGFLGEPDAYPRLIINTIPDAVLRQCEWGKDDYSLSVANLPMSEPKAKNVFELLEEEE